MHDRNQCVRAERDHTEMKRRHTEDDGVYPSVLRVADATDGGLSYGQTLYRYKVYNRLSTLGLVRDNGRGRMYELEITTDGLQALEE